MEEIPARVDRFERRDWLAAALLFLLALALYAPFRSREPYHWDSAEFTLAVKQYNVALSQPHAPGYFLYVMAGRLLDHFLGDAHASLVWLSVLAGGALAAVMYLLGVAMFGRRTGIAAGLFAMTSPQVWFHSCVALTYVVDAFLVSVLVLLCWRAMCRGGGWGDALGIGMAIAVIGGVRQQTAPALVPLLAVTFWNFRASRLAKLGVAVLTASALGLAWFVPMVRLSGGLPLYLEIVQRHAVFNATASGLRGGWTAVTWNMFFMALFCGNGLMTASPVLGAGLVYRIVLLDPARKQAWDREHARALMVLALWLVPMMFFGIAGFTKQPGYVLGYLPALLLLAAVTAAQLKNRWAFAAVTAVVCVVGTAAFLAWPPSWDRVFFGLGRTVREIRHHDEELENAARAARSHYTPAKALVFLSGEFLTFGLRQTQLCLPEFDQYQLSLDPTMVTPPGRPMMCVKNGRLEFVSGIESDDKSVALLVVPKGLSLDIFRPYFDTADATEVPGSGGTLYSVSLDALKRQ